MPSQVPPQALTHELGAVTASPTPSKHLINRAKIEYSKAARGGPGREGRAGTSPSLAPLLSVVQLPNTVRYLYASYMKV